MTPRLLATHRLPLALLLAPALLGPGLLAAETCDTAPDPVISLSYGSRYADDSETRSEIDSEAQDAAEDALEPVDDFLRDLTSLANSVRDDDTDATAAADCAVAQIATWARAGALTDLSSETANLTIGSRIAGFGLVMIQVLPYATPSPDTYLIADWLSGLMRSQTRFWEQDAPSGARNGNLRAWAALGGASVAAINDDPVLRAWSAWSVSHVLCTAAPDGSLPQEMRRGHLALHYQLHAIAPLVVATLLLDRQGISLMDECNGALGNVVAFAINDLDDGEATRAITGEVQSFFDGSDELEGFHLAWIEAYLSLDNAPMAAELDQLAEPMRPLRYSKLGGNQTALWR